MADAPPVPPPAVTPTPLPPSPTLKVSPEEIEVEAGDVQAFSISPAGLLVEWSTEPPGLGRIDEFGIYRAPDKVENQRSFVVKARTPGGAQYGTAKVTLSNAPEAISRLGWFAIGVAALLTLGLIVFWSALNVAPRQPMVVIAPPEVTFDPDQDQPGFAFDAIVFGDLKNGVTWSASDGGIDGKGSYKRPKKAVAAPLDVTITATSVTDPNVRGTAIVHLISGQNLVVQPSAASVFTSQQVPFRVEANTTVSWGRSRTDLGLLDEKAGVYTAPGFVQYTEPFQVTAYGPKAARAAAVVTVNAPFASRFATDWRLLVFVMLMGALGSMLYFSSSFVAYVGNRTFCSSWFWFYISRPFVGGALAIIFFFIAGSGLLNNSASASNLMTIGVIAALVGLFSDRAVRKLSDIFDVVVAAKEDRKDKLEADKTGDKPAAGATAKPYQGASPKIVSTDPAALRKSQAQTLNVKGSNFNNYKVTVNNGPEVDPEQATHESFRIVLTADQTDGDKVTVTVINGDKTTGAFDVKTTEPLAVPAPKPKIDTTVPKTLPKNQATVLSVTGSGFKDCKVQVNGAPATPQDLVDGSFKLSLTAEQTRGDKVTITVVGACGPATMDVPTS
ncbi:MAG TPA: hypothetical protein VGH38_08710 [Bryobacteraceae bacterium]